MKKFAAETIYMSREGVWDGLGRFPRWESRISLASEGMLPPIAPTFSGPEWQGPRFVDVAAFYAQLMGHLDGSISLVAHLSGTLREGDDQGYGAQNFDNTLYALARLLLERGKTEDARALARYLSDPDAVEIINLLADRRYTSAADRIHSTRALAHLPYLASGPWLIRYLQSKGQDAALLNLLNAEAQSKESAQHHNVIEFLVVGFGALADVHRGSRDGPVYLQKAKEIARTTIAVGYNNESRALPKAFAFFLVDPAHLDDDAINACGQFIAEELWRQHPADRYDLPGRLYRSGTAEAWARRIPLWFNAENRYRAAQELCVAALARGYNGDVDGMTHLFAEAARIDPESPFEPRVAMAAACIQNDVDKIRSVIAGKPDPLGEASFILGWHIGSRFDLGRVAELNAFEEPWINQGHLKEGLAVGFIEGQSPYGGSAPPVVGQSN